MEAPSAITRTQGVQSVDRALRILEALGEEHTGLRLSEIAEKVALAPSTAHRLLTTLEQRRFVHYAQASATWFVGRELFRAGAAFVRRKAFVRPALPLMRALRDRTRQTVNVGDPDDGSIVILAQVESRDIVRVVNAIGGRASLSSCGLGKAVLATYAAPALAHHLQRYGLPRMTQHTLHDPAALTADLHASRTRGYAIDREEHLLGLHCVAAPIFDGQGDAVASISVSAPAGPGSVDLDAELGRLVAASAGEVTNSIGGIRPDGWPDGGPHDEAHGERNVR